jgi:hypothetical protein
MRSALTSRAGFSSASRATGDRAYSVVRFSLSARSPDFSVISQMSYYCNIFDMRLFYITCKAKTFIRQGFNWLLLTIFT